MIMALLKEFRYFLWQFNQTFLSQSVSKQTADEFNFDNMVALAQNYRHATDNVTTDYAHGQGDWENGVAYESGPSRVSKNEVAVACCPGPSQNLEDGETWRIGKVEKQYNANTI